jgi:hypothetical protein
LVLLLLLAMEPVQIACFCLHTSFNVGPTNSLGVDILDEKGITKSRNPSSTSVDCTPKSENELLDGLEIEKKNGNWKFVFSLRSSRLTRKLFGWFKFDCDVWGGGGGIIIKFAMYLVNPGNGNGFLPLLPLVCI